MDAGCVRREWPLRPAGLLVSVGVMVEGRVYPLDRVVDVCRQEPYYS